MRSTSRLWVALALLLVPATAWPQSAAIVGAVTDVSGAVLPGVTVEVASPALIERHAHRGDRRTRHLPASSSCGPAPTA